jgi:hypothetical protein
MYWVGGDVGVGTRGDGLLGGGIHIGDSAVGADLGWDCGDRVGEDFAGG